MGVVKTREEALANFEAALPYIPARYESGVKKADWHTPAVSDAAEANFASRMSEVLAKKARQEAIKKLTNKDWQDGALTKGRPIIADRIRIALRAKWLPTWGPMYDAVVGLLGRLPPKGINWRENIERRLVPVVAEWRKQAGKE